MRLHIRPDQVSVVVLFPLEQLSVPPLHESLQVGTSWGGHGDLVAVGPDLQTHQSDEGPQGFVGLQNRRRDERRRRPQHRTSPQKLNLTMFTKLTISKSLFLTAVASRFSFSY